MVAKLVRVLLIGAARCALVGILVLAVLLDLLELGVLGLGVLGLGVLRLGVLAELLTLGVLADLLTLDDLDLVVILVLGVASVVLDDTLLLKKTTHVV